jgi:glycosyltransferase involved in cell wall biosynthesis
MKFLYCHDNVYLETKVAEIYSQGQFPYSYFEPFVQAFGDIAVLGRGRMLDSNYDINKLNLSSGPAADFFLMPNINSVSGLLRHYGEVNARVKDLVAKSDAVIIRAVSDLGWLVYKHARAMGKPIAMEMAACAWDSTWYHGNPLGKFYAFVRHGRDRTICRNADYVLYVTQHFLQSRYPAQGHTAVASNVRIPEPDAACLEKRLAKIAASQPDEILVIGLIGTLGHKLKGIHTALRAMARMERRAPGRFIFRILGPGNPEPYREMAQRLRIGHIVFFEGTIQSGASVLKWLEEVDVYIQPSFQEGVPRATIEAMSVGCPVIGSTAGGIPELLPPEWLHKPGDSDRLETMLENFLNNPHMRRDAAQSNFEKSKFYTGARLVPIRNEFWKNYAAHVRHRLQTARQHGDIKHAF